MKSFLLSIRQRLRWKLLLAMGYALLLIIFLSWFTQQLPLENVVKLVQQISPILLIAWLFVNGGILGVIVWRWYIFLQAVGQIVPFHNLFVYRLVGFAISYATPGTQFGGEPAQVWLVHNKHTVPPAKAIAALTLDRFLDLTASFVILLFSLAIASRSFLESSQQQLQILVSALIPILLIIFYLGLLARGKGVLSHIQLPTKLKFIQAQMLTTERHLQTVLATCRRQFFFAVVLTCLQWSMMLVEFWLTFRLVGFSLNLAELFTLLAAVRLAFLTPAPGALGALEAGLLYAGNTLLGMPLAVVFASALLIRLRDISLTCLGLLLSLVFFTHKRGKFSPP